MKWKRKPAAGSGASVRIRALHTSCGGSTCAILGRVTRFPSSYLKAHSMKVSKRSCVLSFDAAYRRRFGTSLSTAPAEALHWRLEVSLGAPEIELAFDAPEQGSSLKATRQVWFAELGEFRACPVHDRYRLPPGPEIIGPALIEERESTIVVGPSGAAMVGRHR